MGFATWEEARRCSSGPQPGVVAFTKWVMEVYERRGARNWGIYNCRDVAGTNTTSLHGEGRAVDIGFPVGDSDANHLLRRLLSRPGRLGLQAIIYERRIYSAKSPEGRAYDGASPHNDHLHIEFSWEAARQLTYNTVRQVMAPPPRRPGERVLRRGSQGADVRWLQRRLDVQVTGRYGDSTARAVRRFEERQEFRDANGVVGRRTWRALGVEPSF